MEDMTRTMNKTHRIYTKEELRLLNDLRKKKTEVSNLIKNLYSEKAIRDRRKQYAKIKKEIARIHNRAIIRYKERYGNSIIKYENNN